MFNTESQKVGSFPTIGAETRDKTASLANCDSRRGACDIWNR